MGKRFREAGQPVESAIGGRFLLRGRSETRLSDATDFSPEAPLPPCCITERVPVGTIHSPSKNRCGGFEGW